MKYQFFAIPADIPEEAQKELNNFCSNHKVAKIEKHFVPNGNDSFYSFCITYIEGAASKPKYPKSQIDYREVLNEKDFAVYAKLRTLRKELSEKENLPPYALFNNEQLANMVTGRVVTVTDMLAIKGVGKAKMDKYGELFLKILKDEFKPPLKEETLFNKR